MRTVTLQRGQTKAAPWGNFSLSVSTGTVSPYFRISRTDRINNLILNSMLAAVGSLNSTMYPNCGFTVTYFNNTGVVDPAAWYFDISGCTTIPQIKAALEAAVITYSNTNGYGITGNGDILWFDQSAETASAETRSIVTGTGATGFQISATQNADVRYNVTIATTATIGGSASGTVVLEIAPTNSATPSDWVEIGRFTNGQAITLALTLQSVQTIAGQVTGFIPKGYYAKLRSINNTGTPTYTYNSGQKVLM